MDRKVVRDSAEKNTIFFIKENGVSFAMDWLRDWLKDK